MPLSEAQKKKADAANKAYRKRNPEKVKAWQKAWREANREKLRAQYKRHWEANKAKRCAETRAWQKANKERLKAYFKNRYQINREKVLAWQKAWYKANREKSRDWYRKRRALKRTTQTEPISEKVVYLRDGWKCQICHKRVNKRLKYPNPMCASLDHIVPLSEEGTHTYENVQLAHLSCNFSKHTGVLPQGEQMRLF